MTILPVILCGGAGSRLWPASKPECPKPFLALTHPTQTLFAQTLTRVTGNGFAPPLIVGNVAHEVRIRAQLTLLGCDFSALLLEPVARNTAAAIAMAAFWAQQHYGDNVRLLVLPSDHFIANDAAFISAISALNTGLTDGELGLFGIAPTRAETGYGYLECAQGLANSEVANLYPVGRFTEKPSFDLAQTYMASGHHFWNSGMFLFPVRALLAAYAKATPDLLNAARRVWIQAIRHSDALLLPETPMLALKDASIDSEVLQCAASLMMQPLECGWSDVGSWAGLWQAQCMTPQHTRHIQERPWGYFEPIHSGKGYCVKRLWIQAGGKLSLQYHAHRSEHWTIIQGQAQVQCAEAQRLLAVGESIFVPKGMRHRISNEAAEAALEIIEVQLGDYLGEDDIVRLEDAYGRHDEKRYA